MSEPAASIASNPPSDSSAASLAADSTLVSFAGTPTPGFNAAPPSEWAFAAHEASRAGESIDTLREPDGNGLAPIVAVVTFLAGEAELYADAEDALVAMTSTPATFDFAGVANVAEDAGMVMWSGAEAGGEIGIASALLHARSEPILAPHDFGSYGISLDWTDVVLGYS